MAGARPPPIEKTKFKMANEIEVVTYVGDITTLSVETGVTGVVTGEGLEFQHESFVTKALKEYSSEFAEKRDELKSKARYFKSWTVHTTKLSAPSPFRYVFHAVIKSPGRTNKWVKKTGLLYKKIMKKAEKYDVKVLAIPLLGTGRGGATAEDAAQAAVGAVAKFDNSSLKRVFLVTKDTSIADIINSQCEYEKSPLSRKKSLKRRKSFAKMVGCGGSRTDDEDRGSYTKAPRSRQNVVRNQQVPTEKYIPIPESRRHETNIYGNQCTRSMDTSEERERYPPEREDGNSFREATTDDRSGSLRNRRHLGERYTQNASGHRDRSDDRVHYQTNMEHCTQPEPVPRLHIKNNQTVGPGSSSAAVQKDENTSDTPEAMQRPVGGPSEGDNGKREGGVQKNIAVEMHRHHERFDGRDELREDTSEDKKTKDKTMYSCPGPRHNGDSNDGRRQQPSQQTKITMATDVAGRTRFGDSSSRQGHSGKVIHVASCSVDPMTNVDAVGDQPRNVNRTSTTDVEHGTDNSNKQKMAMKTEINGDRNGNNDGTITHFVNGGTLGENKNGSYNNVKVLDMSVTRNCPICICPITDPKWLDKCGHVFCRECIDNSFEKFKPVCPSCNMVYGVLTGNQPGGTMDMAFSGEHLPGYETCGTISITYHLPSGIQGADHPNPGQPYKGTTRRAYLPDCREGRDVLRLLRKAFDRKLTFTIGRSTTTGRDNVVTWNDIHHKTNMEGGPTRFGYPDPDYLERVKGELASKGVTESKETTF